MPKAHELTGAALDYQVAQVLGLEGALISADPEGIVQPMCLHWDEPFCPSSDWDTGGPIMEFAGIGVIRLAEMSWAVPGKDYGGYLTSECESPTALMAAMRKLVADHFGRDHDFA